MSAVCFFDEKNAEFNTASAIARAKGVSLTPIRRDPEHYGAAAELGIRVYGGMASFASNHFLGFRDQLLRSGLQNLLTGCYCDYFFKGLALNRKVNSFTRAESAGAFRHEYYRPLFPLESKAAKLAWERMEQQIDPSLRADQTPEALLQIEARRLFPISYEADSPQRLVPQRVLPWYVPVVDNDVLDVYLDTPPDVKFNAALFSEMVQIVCGPEISRIPDSNTGARVNASGPELLLHVYARALRNRFERKVTPRLATSGSWPNWEYYVHHSPVLRQLWTRNSTAAPDLLRSVAGFDPFARPIESYTGRDTELFVRLLTLKIWFETINSRQTSAAVESTVGDDVRSRKLVGDDVRSRF
ncbi:MAG TPA: hypothetical protein PLH97_05985 [Verrucomicrobiota bacterium]|nr:hypothetical protein [Verrucomicrobiota bacterium]HPU55813.1 hypothetical protein [Verrucomicrobiota bacterium]